MKYSFIPLFLALLLFLGVYHAPTTHSLVSFDVPFTSQAPLGQWSDGRQQYGCEEAALLMAYSWATGQTFTPEQAEMTITAMADYEQWFWGLHHDTSATDTARLMKDYFAYEKVQAVYNITVEDIVQQLNNGSIVIIPVNTTPLNPSRYRRGPVRHTVVVTGYDAATEEFVMHDPYFSWGANLRYKAGNVQQSLRDYPSGWNEPVTEQRTAMIVVSR